MPIRYRISKSNRTATVVAAGSGDLGSTVASIRALAADPEFDPEFSVTVDLCDRKYKPGISDLFRIAGALSSLRSSFRGEIRVIAPESDIGGTRLVCTLASVAGLTITPVVAREPTPRAAGL